MTESNWKPYGENVLVRMCAPPPVSSLIVSPETADGCIGKGPEFKFSQKGVTARVIAIGDGVVELEVGDMVLVDKLAGEPLNAVDLERHDQELRMVREPAIVAVLEP